MEAPTSCISSMSFFFQACLSTMWRGRIRVSERQRHRLKAVTIVLLKMGSYTVPYMLNTRSIHSFHLAALRFAVNQTSLLFKQKVEFYQSHFNNPHIAQLEKPPSSSLVR